MGGLPNVPIPEPHVPQTEELQIDDYRLSKSCGVVERPDHHCGDYLVYLDINKVVLGNFSCSLHCFQDI